MLDGKGLELADGVVSISRYAHSLISGAFSGPHRNPYRTRGHRLFCPGRESRQPENRDLRE